MLAVALHAPLQGTLCVGEFVLANVYLLQVVRPLEMLGSATRDISQAVEFVSPLRQVLQQSAETSHATKRMPLPSTADALEATTVATKHNMSTQDREGVAGLSSQEIHFKYGGGKPVLNGLSLDIAEGRAVAIVGASGSGKSSLVRLLLRLYEPLAGSIRLDGVDIGTLPLATLRSLIAVVPQDTVLFNETVAFNIAIAKADATHAEIERAARLAEVHAFISSLPAGYATVVGERGLKLSGGERQRSAIARAILKRPRVYVFDESNVGAGQRDREGCPVEPAQCVRVLHHAQHRPPTVDHPGCR
jgi:ATP-binding cassette subfamily B protein